ncbi:MAG: thioredoxin [Bacteroidales bacterium]|nr:thioredoxin [Bacteroidales bacterium]
MQTAFIILGGLAVAFFAFVYFAKSSMKNIPNVESHAEILILTDKNFQQQLKNRIVLVDFWAEWCAPCRMMAPVLNEIAAELPADRFVGKLNVEEYQSLSQKFKVRGIPTMILLKDGEEVNRFVGVKSKDFLLKEINNA